MTDNYEHITQNKDSASFYINKILTTLNTDGDQVH